MARRVALLMLAACAGAACMETRETVQRMVMVRTTGSDLQPAATGFIYKKDDDGPASVITMEETEVMEHLSKLYKQPEAFAAPIPVAAGPFYAKEEDKATASSESKVIPVVENEESKDDQIDGIANEDNGKGFGEYASDFGDYKSDFDEYLKSLGYFEDGVYREKGGGDDYGAKDNFEHGEKDHEGFGAKNHYEKEGAGDYHSEKYESFQISGGGGDKKEYDDADSYGAHYANGHAYKGGDNGYKSGHSKGEGDEGFHNLFDKNEYKKDHDFYDGEAVKGGFHKFADGHNNHGSDAGDFKKGGSHESGHHEDHFGKGGYHDRESGEEQGAAHSSEAGGDASHYQSGAFGTDGSKHDDKSYGYEVKH